MTIEVARKNTYTYIHYIHTVYIHYTYTKKKVCEKGSCEYQRWVEILYRGASVF